MESVGGMLFNDYKLTLIATMIEPPKSVVQDEEAFKPA